MRDNVKATKALADEYLGARGVRCLMVRVRCAAICYRVHRHDTWLGAQL